MTFLERLKQLGRDPDSKPEAPGPGPQPTGFEPTTPEGVADLAGEPSAYDRTLWQKKLRSLLDRLPEAEPEWHDFVADGVALGLGHDWIGAQLRSEFGWLIRRTISDRVITAEEERRLETARVLIGMPDADAVGLLESVVAEVQAFYGAGGKP